MVNTLPNAALAIQYRMPAGIPGTISRTAYSRVETAVCSAVAGQTPTAYGQAIVLDATTGQMRLPVPADPRIHGFIVRAFPTMSQAPANVGNEVIGVAVPIAGIPQDFMVGGYMSVLLGGSATPVREGQVYVWLGATAGLHVQGQVEAAGANTWVTAAKGGGNTGNGTFTAGPVEGSQFMVGTYILTMLTATTFSVVNPAGENLPNGATGVPYNNSELSFTLTAGGTAFVAGDAFNLTVAPSAVLVPSCYFMGPADTNGVTEIAFRIN